jgi:two-component system sensor histidine kinase HydH
MPSFSEKSARWRVGLLVTTIMMGAALAVSGVSGYLQARGNAAALTEVELMGMFNGLRREIGRSGGEVDAAVTSFVVDSNEQGLRYVALLDTLGRVLAEFGRAEVPFDPGFYRAARLLPLKGPGRGTRPPLIQQVNEGVVHAAVPLPRRAWRRGGFPEGERPHVIAFEAASKRGPAIVSSALFTLAVSLGAAALLVIAALMFWRQSVLAEAERLTMIEQLEKDKRLKALGRMSAVLGHELKNPIAGLKGHAQLLLEKLGAEDHPAMKQARTVVREAELLESLTTQVLEFARKGELKLSKVYLDDLADTAAALSGIGGVNVVAPQETTWHLDRARMEEAVVNLLANARQASGPEDPIDLIFEIRNKILTITVRDRGDGIPTADLERIFEPFVTTKTRGTGLGLAVVKRIVEAHGGRVSAQNHEAGGAALVLEIPEPKSPATRGAPDA